MEYEKGRMERMRMSDVGWLIFYRIRAFIFDPLGSSLELSFCRHNSAVEPIDSWPFLHPFTRSSAIPHRFYAGGQERRYFGLLYGTRLDTHLQDTFSSASQSGPSASSMIQRWRKLVSHRGQTCNPDDWCRIFSATIILLGFATTRK